MSDPREVEMMANEMPKIPGQPSLSVVEQRRDLHGDVDAGAAMPGGLRRRFLTIANAAVYTDLSTESIRRLICAGKLTALRPVRGRILLDRVELDAVVRASTSNPKTGRGRRPRS